MAPRAFVFALAAFAALAVVSNPTQKDRLLHLAQSQTQTYSACITSCNSQSVQCTSPCLNVIPGTTTLVGTAVSSVGSTNNQTQCFLNCTTQQMVCQQKCSGLQ
jgi:hypothetical protein